MRQSQEDQGRRYQNKNIIDYNHKRSNESINTSDKRDYRGKIDMDSGVTHPIPWVLIQKSDILHGLMQPSF